MCRLPSATRTLVERELALGASLLWLADVRPPAYGASANPMLKLAQQLASVLEDGNPPRQDRRRTEGSGADQLRLTPVSAPLDG